MPLLAQLFATIFAQAGAIITAILTVLIGLKLLKITALATLYIATVIAFTAFVHPLMQSIFSSPYGQLLGLVFPPISGTVLTGLGLLYSGILLNRYLRSLIRVI